jgi:hypothetical protein
VSSAVVKTRDTTSAIAHDTHGLPVPIDGIALGAEHAATRQRDRNMERRDHDITKRPPTFWAIPVLEKTPWAAFVDTAQRKNQMWLRSAEILQWGQEKIHVSFAYRRADVAARSAGPER